MSRKDVLTTLPARTKSRLAGAMLDCIKRAGTTQKKLRKLYLANPKKAATLTKRLHACIMKKMRVR